MEGVRLPACPRQRQSTTSMTESELADAVEAKPSPRSKEAALATVHRELLRRFELKLMERQHLRQLLIGPVSFSCAGVVVPLEVNPAARVAFQLTAALQTAITDGEGIAKCLQWNGPLWLLLIYSEGGGTNDARRATPVVHPLSASASTTEGHCTDCPRHENIAPMLLCHLCRRYGLPRSELTRCPPCLMAPHRAAHWEEDALNPTQELRRATLGARRAPPGGSRRAAPRGRSRRRAPWR